MNKFRIMGYERKWCMQLIGHRLTDNAVCLGLLPPFLIAGNHYNWSSHLSSRDESKCYV